MGNFTGGQLVVKCLEAQGVEYVFGIPGAKIDTVFDALEDSPIQLIERNRCAATYHIIVRGWLR